MAAAIFTAVVEAGTNHHHQDRNSKIETEIESEHHHRGHLTDIIINSIMHCINNNIIIIYF